MLTRLGYLRIEAIPGLALSLVLTACAGDSSTNPPIDGTGNRPSDSSAHSNPILPWDPWAPDVVYVPDSLFQADTVYTRMLPDEDTTGIVLDREWQFAPSHGYWYGLRPWNHATWFKVTREIFLVAASDADSVLAVARSLIEQRGDFIAWHRGGRMFYIGIPGPVFVGEDFLYLEVIDYYCQRRTVFVDVNPLPAPQDN